MLDKRYDLVDKVHGKVTFGVWTVSTLARIWENELSSNGQDGVEPTRAGNWG